MYISCHFYPLMYFMDLLFTLHVSPTFLPSFACLPLVPLVLCSPLLPEILHPDPYSLNTNTRIHPCTVNILIDFKSLNGPQLTRLDSAYHYYELNFFHCMCLTLLTGPTVILAHPITNDTIANFLSKKFIR